jgi:hypothetical protein
MATAGKSAAVAESATLGKSAADIGDQLYIDTVQPAWPQSKPAVLVQEGDDRLLLQEGFLVAGQSAAEGV